MSGDRIEFGCGAVTHVAYNLKHDDDAQFMLEAAEISEEAMEVEATYFDWGTGNNLAMDPPKIFTYHQKGEYLAHGESYLEWGYWADLDPAVGREQRGARRPVMVISNDGFNAHFDVVTVLPLTKGGEKGRRVYPFEVEIPVGTLSDRFASIVMPHQIRTLSRIRILERLGAVSDPGLQRAIEDRLLEHLGIEFSLWQPEA